MKSIQTSRPVNRALRLATLAMFTGTLWAGAQEIAVSTPDLPTIGSMDTVTVSLRNVPQSVVIADVIVRFDTTVVQGTAAEVTPGGCPATDLLFANEVDNTAGTARLGASLLPPTPACGNPAGDITVFTFDLERIAAGDHGLEVVVDDVGGEDGTWLTHLFKDGFESGLTQAWSSTVQ